MIVGLISIEVLLVVSVADVYHAVIFGIKFCFFARWAKHITEAAKPQNTSDIWLDISTHNVGLPALSIKNPDCHGFLNKLGAIRKNWKRRFCVLKDACLYYYKDIDAQHALG